MTNTAQPQRPFTSSQQQRFEEFVRVMATMREQIGLICCPFLQLNALKDSLLSHAFHRIDCELFRTRELDTDEFCRLLEWEQHAAFALFVPRVIPTVLCRFFYHAADSDLVCVESGRPPKGTRRKLNEKSWLVIMTPEDLSGAELENGWHKERFTRVLGPFCHLDR